MHIGGGIGLHVLVSPVWLNSFFLSEVLCHDEIFPTGDSLQLVSAFPWQWLTPKTRTVSWIVIALELPVLCHSIMYIYMQTYMFNSNQQRQIQKPRYTSIDHSRLFEKFQLDWIIYKQVRLTESDLIVQILIMSSSLLPICVVSPKTWKGKMS